MANERDDGDLSPEVAARVQRTGRLHLAIFLWILGLLCIVLPRMISMPAQDTEFAVTFANRTNIAEIATTNSTVMGVVGIVAGLVVFFVRRAPRRWTRL